MHASNRWGYLQIHLPQIAMSEPKQKSKEGRDFGLVSVGLVCLVFLPHCWGSCVDGCIIAAIALPVALRAAVLDQNSLRVAVLY